MDPLTKRLWSYLCRVAAPMPEVPILEVLQLCAACAEGAERADERTLSLAINDLIEQGALRKMSADDKTAMQKGKLAQGNHVIVLRPNAETMYLTVSSPESLRRQLLIERDALKEELARPTQTASEPTVPEQLAVSMGLSQREIAEQFARPSSNFIWLDLADRDAQFLLDFWLWAVRANREDEKRRCIDYLSHLHQRELEDRKKGKLALEHRQDQARGRITEIETLLRDSALAPTVATGAQPNERVAIPLDVQREVWRRDQGRCVYCTSQENLEFDHIIPVVKGGSSTVRNIQLLCQSCNRTKSANL